MKFVMKRDVWINSLDGTWNDFPCQFGSLDCKNESGIPVKTVNPR
jgi:hypothetical protein